MNHIHVVGYGCAGFHAVKAMRECGFTGEIHVHSDIAGAVENPMLTTYYTAGKLPRHGAYQLAALEEAARKYDLVLHTGEAVKKVDTVAKTLELAGGWRLPYGKLLIATGASAVVPPVPGLGKVDTYVMRSMADADRLKARLEQGGLKSALVVGASMIGIKVVELLYNLNINCTLADIAPHIFPLAALDFTATEIERRLADKGVGLVLGNGIAKVEHNKDGMTAVFSDGNTVRTDLIVLCVGTRPNISIADPAQIDVNQGILVDDGMRTSAPDIYAAGDCCEGYNLQNGAHQVIGLWANAGAQGKTAGINLSGCGIAARMDGNIIHNITHFMDMDFISLGDKRLSGSLQRFDAGEILIEAMVDNDRINCINLLGGHEISGVVKSRMIKQLRAAGEGMGAMAEGLLRRHNIPARLISLLGGTAS